MAALLIDDGRVDINIGEVFDSGSYGRNPLHCAVYYEYADIARLLIEHGAAYTFEEEAGREICIVAGEPLEDFEYSCMKEAIASSNDDDESPLPLIDLGLYV